MRVIARRRSSASMTRDRTTKTPPCGGAAARSRSAKRDLSMPCQPHRTGVNGSSEFSAVVSTDRRPLLAEALQRADLFGDATEHAVDEASGLLGRIAAGQL